jgi:TPR repeat protein
MPKTVLLRFLFAGLAVICTFYGGNAGAQHKPGISQAQAKAGEEYRKAAERGYANAQKKLGDAYYNGEGVAQDHATALAWWRKAAEQGNAQAKEALQRENM